MPHLPDDQLLKAAANVGRIADFVSSRSGWHPPASDAPALTHLVDAARSLSATVAAHGGQPDPAALEPPAANDPANPLETARIERFALYLEEVARWFSSLNGATASAHGAPSLTAVATSVATIGVSVEQMLERADVQPETSPPEHTPAPPPMPTVPSGPPPVAVPTGPSSRLILEDTTEQPLLQEFQGNVELTQDAEKRLQGFLGSNDIELNSYELRKLEEKVRRWVEATPDGQSLVLKIGGLHGKREPYPSYVPREVARQMANAE